MYLVYGGSSATSMHCLLFLVMPHGLCRLNGTTRTSIIMLTTWDGTRGLSTVVTQCAPTLLVTTPCFKLFTNSAVLLRVIRVELSSGK